MWCEAGMETRMSTQTRIMEKVVGTPDSFVVRNFIDDKLARDIVVVLEGEIQWPMHGQKNAPRAVFQADGDEESFAYLRCPSIKPAEMMPFSPTVAAIVETVNSAPFQPRAKCNIAKVLKYEGPSTALKNHADKIVDLSEGCNIYTLRFGQTRTLLLKNKGSGAEILVELPHNTLFILGWGTNRFWTHGAPRIAPILDGASGNSQMEPSYSIVLRTSVTWLHRPTLRLWGPRTKFSTLVALLESPAPTDEELEKAQVELTHLWATENDQPVELSHYSAMFNK
jgi:hypothetical protein